MRYADEYVGCGHPDRLCDRIVERIVDRVVKRDSDALCGLECAVHTDKVFVDGRIAAGRGKTVIDRTEIEEIVRSVYRDAGYSADRTSPGKESWWHPYDTELTVYQDVCIEPLSDDERDLRRYSDDQNVVSGYALNDPRTGYLPVAHFVANKVGREFDSLFRTDPRYGSDYKILVDLDCDGKLYRWNRLTVSIHHHREVDFQTLYGDVKERVVRSLTGLLPGLLEPFDVERLFVNGAGDFIQGGPMGDNGLSGKKLVVDFYGPEVPIGGGAICGKDPHKIDVCGPLRARQLAVNLVRETGFREVYTQLFWSPGESAPHTISAYGSDEFGTRIEIPQSRLPAQDTFSIECCNNDMKLASVSKEGMVMEGYMFRSLGKE